MVVVSPDLTLLLLDPINSVNIVQAQQSTIQAQPSYKHKI
jgi:hypothetical protein